MAAKKKPKSRRPAPKKGKGKPRAPKRKERADSDAQRDAPSWRAERSVMSARTIEDVVGPANRPPVSGALAELSESEREEVADLLRKPWDPLSSVSVAEVDRIHAAWTALESAAGGDHPTLLARTQEFESAVLQTSVRPRHGDVGVAFRRTYAEFAYAKEPRRGELARGVAWCGVWILWNLYYLRGEPTPRVLVVEPDPDDSLEYMQLRDSTKKVAAVGGHGIKYVAKSWDPALVTAWLRHFASYLDKTGGTLCPASPRMPDPLATGEPEAVQAGDAAPAPNSFEVPTDSPTKLSAEQSDASRQIRTKTGRLRDPVRNILLAASREQPRQLEVLRKRTPYSDCAYIARFTPALRLIGALKETSEGFIKTEYGERLLLDG